MLAIVGGKGGCGKTTTALGLARALADQGERPLVVDADCDMPNLHTMADTDRTPGVDALADGAPIDTLVHRSRTVPGVEVLPAGRSTGPLDSAALRRLRHVPGRVILDCPAGASEAVANPVRAADAALVVSTTDQASQVDAVKTARIVEALETRMLGIVLTRTTGSQANSRRDPPLSRLSEVVVDVPEVDGLTGPIVGEPVARAAYDRLAQHLRERNI